MNHQKAEFEVLADIAKLLRQRKAIFTLARHGGDHKSIEVLMRYNRRDLRESIETLRQLRDMPRHRRRFPQMLLFPARPQICGVTQSCRDVAPGQLAGGAEIGSAADFNGCKTPLSFCGNLGEGGAWL